MGKIFQCCCQKVGPKISSLKSFFSAAIVEKSLLICLWWKSILKTTTIKSNFCEGQTLDSLKAHINTNLMQLVWFNHTQQYQVRNLIHVIYAVKVLPHLAISIITSGCIVAKKPYRWFLWENVHSIWKFKGTP